MVLLQVVLSVFLVLATDCAGINRAVRQYRSVYEEFPGVREAVSLLKASHLSYLNATTTSEMIHEYWFSTELVTFVNWVRLYQKPMSSMIGFYSYNALTNLARLDVRHVDPRDLASALHTYTHQYVHACDEEDYPSARVLELQRLRPCPDINGVDRVYQVGGIDECRTALYERPELPEHGAKHVPNEYDLVDYDERIVSLLSYTTNIASVWAYDYYELVFTLFGGGTDYLGEFCRRNRVLFQCKLLASIVRDRRPTNHSDPFALAEKLASRIRSEGLPIDEGLVLSLGKFYHGDRGYVLFYLYHLAQSHIPACEQRANRSVHQEELDKLLHPPPIPFPDLDPNSDTPKETAAGPNLGRIITGVLVLGFGLTFICIKCWLCCSRWVDGDRDDRQNI